MLFYTVALLCVVVPLLYRLYNVGRRPKDLPPGPPTLPILGNLHQMAAGLKEPHLQFQKWAKEYGPIYSLMLGTKTMIVLSEDTLFKELLDKRGAIYSSKPDLYIAEMMTGGLRPSMRVYGPKWRSQRKIFHSALTAQKVQTYEPYLDIEVKQLLFDVMTEPKTLLQHFRRFSSSVITSAVYGFRWPTFNDPKLQEFFTLVEDLLHMSTSGFTTLPDVYPILRSIPQSLYPMVTRAKKHHEHEKQVYLEHYLRAKHALTNNLPSARPCTCSDIIAAQEEQGFSDVEAAYVAVSLFEAGSETTSSELYGFTQAMLLYPDAQARAQAEIDAICGDSPPTFSDISRLPYVRACVKETLRWMAATPTGAVPHSLMQEDVYNGYRLPKDAIVLLNIFTIHRDEKRYPNAAHFRPERYLNDHTTAAESFAQPDVSLRDHFGFGSGRRVCAGMHLAEKSMSIAIASLLWAFELKPPIGPDGKEIFPKQDVFVPGPATRPVEFGVRVVPRKGRESVVREMWEGVKESDRVPTSSEVYRYQ